MRLALQLITYNSEKYLPFLFKSLQKQTFTDWQLSILDNTSSDKTVEIIKEEIKKFTQSVNLTISKENLGFAGGHNALFKQLTSEYVLLLNPDIYLAEDCIEKLVGFLDAHQETGVVTARLMKWNFLESTSQRLELGFSNIVDSLGLKVYRSRRVVEWQAGKNYEEVKNNFTNLSYLEVFGVSGALPLFRRNALEKVWDSEGNIFDPLFHVYKEDVDLAFRLRKTGYKAYVILDTVAYHDRTAAMPEQSGDSGAAENKKKQSELIKYHSYKNHLMMICKNEYWQNLILDFPWVFWYELKKVVWLFLFDRKVLRGLKEVWIQRKKLKNERKRIKEIRKIEWKELRKWWS